MSRRLRAVVPCIAAALALSVAGSSCSTKIDREGTKKLILKQLAGQKISDTDAQCVARLLDGYSDADLKALDDEFTKSKAGATSELAKGFQTKTVECIRPSTTAAVIAALKQSVPSLTAAQEQCATDFIAKLSTDDLKAMAADDTKANDIGVALAKQCLSS